MTGFWSLLSWITTPCAMVFVFAMGLPFCRAQNRGAVTADEDHRSRSRYSELANVPEKAQAKRNPLERDPDAVAAGGKLFEQHCAECHGAKAAGTKRGPSLRMEPVEQATPGTLFWILTNGVVRNGMPDWSKLPEPQRWQLVGFIKSLGGGPRKAGPAFPEAAPPTPPPVKDSPLPRR